MLQARHFQLACRVSWVPPSPAALQAVARDFKVRVIVHKARCKGVVLLLLLLKRCAHLAQGCLQGVR